MKFDVVIVGAGPAGLAAAIRIKQLQAKSDRDISVVIIEKSAEVGGHILSGAVLDPSALNELLSDWHNDPTCPIDTPVSQERFLYLRKNSAIPIPIWPMPKMMKNHGCYVVSMGAVCRWLSDRAEALGVDIFPAMAASEVVYSSEGAVKGVVVGEVGRGRDGKPKDSYEPGIELQADYTILAEGARGSLSKLIIDKFALDSNSQEQKFGLGVKELWQVDNKRFKKGLVQHTFGWPFTNDIGGGSWMYHFGKNYVSIGLVTHLNYANPYISPYEEFQRLKTHPRMKGFLEGGRRIAYGARVISEGGLQSIPKLVFPGGALIGCAAGLVNLPRIKGNHNAMKSGILLAEAAIDSLEDPSNKTDLSAYQEAFDKSSIYDELHKVRNVKPLWSRYGTILGAITLTGLDLSLTTRLKGWSPFGTLKHRKSDAKSLKPAEGFKPITYPKPDNIITFDRLTNLAYSSTNHVEDQPIHLKLIDEKVQTDINYKVFAGPSARYCPAGVYEFVPDGDDVRFQINAQNCIHCKTCDLKDPSENIIWTAPEGGGGPNYPNM